MRQTAKHRPQLATGSHCVFNDDNTQADMLEIEVDLVVRVCNITLLTIGKI